MVAIIVPDQTHGNNCQSRVPIYLELMRLSRALVAQLRVRSKPWNSERKGDSRRTTIEDAEQSEEGDRKKRQRCDKATSVDDVARARSVPDRDGERRRRDEHCSAGE